MEQTLLLKEHFDKIYKPKKKKKLLKKHLIKKKLLIKKSGICHSKENCFCKKIYKAICKILQSPYYKNKAVASNNIQCTSHEKYIASIFDRCGFTCVKKPKNFKRKDVIQWIEKPELATILENGTYISQPFGTQNSPDFIIKIHEKFILFLEAKSANVCKPQYNSGGINRDFLYVFCSKKKNQTTIFLGSNIITSDMKKSINKYIQESRKRDEIFNIELQKSDLYHRGISFYSRPMITQKGDASYTNYFTHKHKNIVEKHVLNWLKEKCNLKTNGDQWKTLYNQRNQEKAEFKTKADSMSTPTHKQCVEGLSQSVKNQLLEFLLDRVDEETQQAVERFLIAKQSIDAVA